MRPDPLTNSQLLAATVGGELRLRIANRTIRVTLMPIASSTTTDKLKSAREKARPRFTVMSSGKPRSLKEALKGVPSDDEQAKILIDLGDSSAADGAAAPVDSAILDASLRDAIARRFSPGADEKETAKIFAFDSNGPLADFSAKIKLAYALGKGKEKTRRDLDKIRRIRSIFARTPRLINLADQEVRHMIDSMYIVEQAPLLTLSGLNYKQKFCYIISSYHFALRTHEPDRKNDYSLYYWFSILP